VQEHALIGGFYMEIKYLLLEYRSCNNEKITFPY
jgi:hypothetical protein